MEWQIAPSFNAADELLNDNGLGDVFKAAIGKGWAVISRPGMKAKK
jgi:hypothetical protein